MDKDKKLDETVLEGVTGGGPQALLDFGEDFRWKNCRFCSKWDNGCPYKDTKALYDAFQGDGGATCPLRE